MNEGTESEASPFVDESIFNEMLEPEGLLSRAAAAEKRKLPTSPVKKETKVLKKQ